jgi:curli biogenesis system outer membrane secretion channel CsgG
MKQICSLIKTAIIITIVISSCATEPVLSESFATERSQAGESGSIADAVHDGYTNVRKMIPAKRRVVVLGVTGKDASEAAWAGDELIQLLVSAKRHVVIDRRGLDVELAEKKPTGEIQEASAQDIGYLLGAEVVLYGNISHYENQVRFLSLKAMDVRSGDIIAITSERYKAG